MKFIARYILILVIALSSVYITNRVIDYKREINQLESFQISAKEKSSKMLSPVVRLTFLIPNVDVDENEGPDPADSPMDISMTTATGFSIEYNARSNVSLIITNAHFCDIIETRDDTVLVTENSETLRSEMPSQSGYASNVLYIDPYLDLCLVEAFGFVRPAILAEIDYDIQDFEKVYVVGSPSGVLPIIIDTYISAAVDRRDVKLGRMNQRGMPYIMMSEQVFPGHSGSPIYNQNGEVIGVTFASLSSYGGLGISVRDLYTFLQDYEAIISR
jgi:S1-C subfamily serine protease